MAQMNQWHLTLKNENLNSIYQNYLYKADTILRYYLSCIAFDQFTVFQESDLGESVSASDNFHESATSIRTLNDIKLMRDSGEFAHLSRTQCIILLITAFTDFFEELLHLMQISPHEIKKPVELKLPNKLLIIRPASLKIAHYLSRKYDLIEPLTGNQGMQWINSMINIRHIFIHSQGRFNESYRDFVQHPWDKMQHGEQITFDKNSFDSVLWFLSDNLRPFVRALDEKI
jgi:hypothetical protein